MRPVVAALGVGAVLLTMPTDVAAGDGLRVRTPVVWDDTACMTVVDRSVDPVLHIPYAIPFEDVGTTVDEVPDGRRHQFFGFCRTHAANDPLPNWISVADVDAAEAVELVEPATVDGDAVLDLSRAWTGCVTRVNADDDRRPITFEAAEEGVDWDTRQVEPGAWVLEGFTNDPPLSVWSSRPGVVKVVDDPALEASGPAAAVSTQETVVEAGSTITIEGCVSAMPGSVLNLRWAAVGDRSWTTAVEDRVVSGPEFTVEFSLPNDLAGQAARIQIEIVDPEGRDTTADMRDLVLVLPAPFDCSADECGSTGEPDPPGNDQGDSTSGTSEDDVSSSGTGNAPMPDDADTDATGQNIDGGSCACTHQPTSGSGAALFALAFALCRRRRARSERREASLMVMHPPVVGVSRTVSEAADSARETVERLLQVEIAEKIVLGDQRFLRGALSLQDPGAALVTELESVSES